MYKINKVKYLKTVKRYLTINCLKCDPLKFKFWISKKPKFS